MIGAAASMAAAISTISDVGLVSVCTLPAWFGILSALLWQGYMTLSIAVA